YWKNLRRETRKPERWTRDDFSTTPSSARCRPTVLSTRFTDKQTLTFLAGAGDPWLSLVIPHGLTPPCRSMGRLIQRLQFDDRGAVVAAYPERDWCRRTVHKHSANVRRLG